MISHFVGQPFLGRFCEDGVRWASGVGWVKWVGKWLLFRAYTGSSTDEAFEV